MPDKTLSQDCEYGKIGQLNYSRRRGAWKEGKEGLAYY